MLNELAECKREHAFAIKCLDRANKALDTEELTEDMAMAVKTLMWLYGAYENGQEIINQENKIEERKIKLTKELSELQGEIDPIVPRIGAMTVSIVEESTFVPTDSGIKEEATTVQETQDKLMDDINEALNVDMMYDEKILRGEELGTN